MEREDLRKKVDLAFLSAFYGGMLTENQRRILSLHCEEDLSLSEIAEETGISRQAAHETLNRAAAKRTEMEEALGAAKRFRRMETGLEEALFLLRKQAYPEAEQKLEELLNIETEDGNGI